jgi:hypothetical protein
VRANNCWLIPEACIGTEIEVSADGMGNVSDLGGKNANDIGFRALIAADTPAARLAD